MIEKPALDLVLKDVDFALDRGSNEVVGSKARTYREVSHRHFGRPNGRRVSGERSREADDILAPRHLLRGGDSSAGA
ncbi:MAG TPA: hypothetical protein VGL03_04535 [Thermoanaerobaculia bacterium]|jgi:hypothetical protein